MHLIDRITRHAEVEEEPLRLSFDGQLALIPHAGRVLACDVGQLVEALERAPIIGRVEQTQPVANGS